MQNSVVTTAFGVGGRTLAGRQKPRIDERTDPSATPRVSSMQTSVVRVLESVSEYAIHFTLDGDSQEFKLPASPWPGRESDGFVVAQFAALTSSGVSPFRSRDRATLFASAFHCATADLVSGSGRSLSATPSAQQTSSSLLARRSEAGCFGFDKRSEACSLLCRAHPIIHRS